MKATGKSVCYKRHLSSSVTSVEAPSKTADAIQQPKPVRKIKHILTFFIARLRDMEVIM